MKAAQSSHQGSQIADLLFGFPTLLFGKLKQAARLVWEWAKVEADRDRWFWPASVAFLGQIIGFQIAGGAYQAEFNSHPDEPAHFVSGLMVHDYLASLPFVNPMHWAEQYYFHYPKVAIGHWPPFFYILEAAWWLILTPSRLTAMALNAGLAWLAAVLLYRMLRSFAAPWLALSSTLLLIATPVVQESFEQSMADLPCLVWATLVLSATVRLLRKPSESTALWTGFCLVGALLTKGTGACLVPVPLLALAMSGGWRVILTRRVLSGLVVLAALGMAWYGAQFALMRENIVNVGGFTTRVPWSAFLIPGLAGWGVSVLAAVGLYVALLDRRPETVAAALLLLSTCAASFVLRAMNEPRHMIIVMPALLVLASVAVTRMARSFRLAAILAPAALVLFPFSVYRQHPAGFEALLAQVPHPARMLVSGSATGEGAWIVAVALSENRPSSVVFRASKVLATSGWNGEHYEPKVTTATELEHLLDSLGVNLVILQLDADADSIPHRRLIAASLPQSSSWRACGSAEKLTAYCRTKEPVNPGPAPELDLRDRIGVMVHP